MSRESYATHDDIRRVVASELSVPQAEIDDTENLIEAGLASLSLMRLAASWRAKGFAVDFSELAAEPTVDAWARLFAGGGRVPVEARDSTHGLGDVHAHDRTSFPLATMQHGYWVGRTEGQPLGGVAAHLYGEFDGHIDDPDRLRRAVDRTVTRHAALRTRFLDEGGQEVLDAPGKPVFSVVDLRDQPEGVIEVRLAELREVRAHQLLDIGAGQVIDVGLTLLPAGGSRLHVDVDMIAADAVSYRMILADLARFYRGEQPEPVTFSYDYRRYLRDHDAATAPVRDREEAWWAERIADYPDAPSLPLVAEATAGEPRRSVRFGHQLSASQYEVLRERARRHGVTPAMVMAAVFSDVITRWSTNRRFLLNLPLFDRQPLHPDVAAMAGDFSNSILLDVSVDPTVSFVERARTIQKNLHEHAAHAAYRGLDVLRDLGRQAGSPVLAPIVYTSALDLGEMFAPVVTEEFGEHVWTISQGPQVVLDAQVSELCGGVLLNWDVRRDMFPPGLVETMFDAYRNLVEALLAEDADWSARLEIPLPEEQRRTRELVNCTAQDLPERTLHGEFFRIAVERPAAPAVLWGESGVLSYGELADQALRLAAALQGLGVQHGDTVAVHVRKGHQQIPAVLGVLAAGATYLPIGEDQPSARRDTILDRGRARVVLLDRQIDDLPVEVVPVMVDEAIRHRHPLAATVEVSPSDIAYVLFTSGSTGEPKGVELPHSAAGNTIDGVISEFGLTEEDRTLGISVLEFDLSVADIFIPLALGGAIITVNSTEAKDAMAWAELAGRHRASAITCAPGIMRMLLEVATREQLQHLHAVMLGGDWVTVDLPKRLRELAPQARFAGLGGTTETAIHCTVCEVGEDIPEHWQAVPYGTPLPNFACRVVNESGQDAPDWVAGELWIGGPSVGAGYRGDPERTADRFVEFDDRRWYRSGDLARYLPDGSIEFLGRTDHQVKVRGYRIELGEVEAALRAIDGVEVAVADTVGPGSPRLAAAVTGTADLHADVIRGGLAKALPDYMIPERIEVLAEIPLTTNGKLDRRAVRAQLEAGGAIESSTPPADGLEAAVQHIVSGVLPGGLNSVTVDFFAAGGDSILATSAIARMRSLLQVTTITAADFFSARTVRDISALLRSREDADSPLDAIADIYLEVAEVPTG